MRTLRRLMRLWRYLTVPVGTSSPLDATLIATVGAGSPVLPLVVDHLTDSPASPAPPQHHTPTSGASAP